MPEQELADATAVATSDGVQPDATGEAPLDAGADIGIDASDAQALTQQDADQQPAPEGQEVTGEPFSASPPDWFKALYADPQHGKDAQRLWDRMVSAQQMRELYPTLADARAAKEAIESIGGKEAIQELVNKAQSVDDTDAAFFSGDKQRQAGVISEMFSEDPEAFTSGVLVSLDVIQRVDPERYKSLAGQVLGSVLKPERFDEHVEALREAAASGDQQQVAKLVQALVNWADAKGLSQQSVNRLDPRRSEIEQQKSQLQEREQQFRAEQYGQAREYVDSDVRARLNQDITSELSKLLPRTREAVRERIARDISNDISNALAADKNLLNRSVQLFHPSATQYRFDRGTQQQVASLIYNRARQLVTAATKKVVSDWTREVVSQNQQVLKKTEQAARRADITGGAPPGASGKPPLTEEMAKKMSSEEILTYDGPVAQRRR